MKEWGQFIYEQVGAYGVLPEHIKTDCTLEDVKKIVCNLIYLWVVHHGQTFSNTSVLNNWYVAPSVVRKPLSWLESNEVNETNKA